MRAWCAGCSDERGVDGGVCGGGVIAGSTGWGWLCRVGDDRGIVNLFVVGCWWVTWAGCCGIVSAIVGGLGGVAAVSVACGADIEEWGGGWCVLRFLVWGRSVEAGALGRIVFAVMVGDVVSKALSGGWEGCLAEGASCAVAYIGSMVASAVDAGKFG